MAIDAHAVRPELEHASGAGGPLGDSRSVQPWLYRRGSNQGNTRSTETLGWRGFGEIQCNPETALLNHAHVRLSLVGWQTSRIEPQKRICQLTAPIRRWKLIAVCEAAVS